MKKLILLLFILMATLTFSDRERERSWKNIEIEGLELPWEKVEIDDLNPLEDIDVEIDDLIPLDSDIKIKNGKIKLESIEIGDIKIKSKSHKWKDRDDDDDEDDEDDD